MLRKRVGGKYPDEQLVTAWIMHPGETAQAVVFGEIRAVAHGDWSVTHNCFTVAASVVMAHAPVECKVLMGAEALLLFNKCLTGLTEGALNKIYEQRS